MVLLENMLVVVVFWYFAKPTERPSPAGMLGITVTTIIACVDFWTCLRSALSSPSQSLPSSL